mmetsp:Transcript_6256/g.12288  ORF Transcript_6256/g.12288 Transcript_6256/m.12288 type:complete len:494 (-) Transcript_6256:63-1544(-)
MMSVSVAIWIGVCVLHLLCLTTLGVSRVVSRTPGLFIRPSSPRVERVAVISDPHLAGPEYHLNTETNELDNESVVRSQMRMYLTAQQLVAALGVDPSPKLAVLLGDVVHSGLGILQSDFGIDEHGVQKLFDMDVNGYTIGIDIFESIPLPKVFVWGNHDSLLTCGKPKHTMPKDLLEKVYRHYFNASAYSSTEVDHWKIIGLNSVWGTTWDPSSPQCNQLLSSFGKKQLMWLDEELSRTNASHVALFFHFPPGTIKLNEIEKGDDDGITDLRSVLKKHDTIRLVLTGHFHKGVTWGHLFGDVIPVVTLPSTRYNSENFFNLDLYANGSWSIVDLDKNRNGARCSDWYVYDEDTPNGKFEATFRPKDPGNCGRPRVSEESTWKVEPITSLKEYPSNSVFNPEGSCRFMYAPAFFTTCLEDDFLENGCCDVLSKAFWPTSSHVFSACLCQTDFWNSTVKYFASQSRNASSVMQQCAENKVFLIWPGSTDTWCSLQ